MAAAKPDCSSATKIAGAASVISASRGLTVDRDPLSPHLIFFNRRWVAVGRDVLADGDDLFRRSATAHARGGRERHRPHLVIAPHRDGGVRVLELGGHDRTGNGHRFTCVVTAPPVMRESGARQQREGGKEDDGSHHGGSKEECISASL